MFVLLILAAKALAGLTTLTGGAILTLEHLKGKKQEAVYEKLLDGKVTVHFPDAHGQGNRTAVTTGGQALLLARVEKAMRESGKVPGDVSWINQWEALTAHMKLTWLPE